MDIREEKLKRYKRYASTFLSLSLSLSRSYTPEEKLMTRAWNDAASAKKYVNGGGERKDNGFIYSQEFVTRI